MKLTIVLSFFFCFFLISSVIGKVHNGIDSKDLVVDSLQLPQDSLKNIVAKIRVFAKQKNYDHAIVLSRELLHKATLISDSLYMANANRRLGFYFKKTNKIDSAFVYFNESYKISVKLGDSLESATRLLDMANIQKRSSDFLGCKITAIDGLRYLPINAKKSVSSGLYHIISVSALEQNDYSEALKWNNRAIETLISNKSSSIIFMNTRANILGAQGNYERSIEILYKLLRDSLVRNNPLQFARIQCNLGRILFKQKGQNPEAENYLLSSLKIRTKQKTISGLISGNIHLANYYLNYDDIKALKYAKEALINAQLLKSPVPILEALDILIPLKKKLKKAVDEEAVLYSRVQNKLERTRQDIRRIYATTKYDNDELSRENLILKAETARKEKQSAIYLSALIFAVGIGGFLIYYKNAQKKKATLEASYKAEIKVAKKIHDELGNDIFYLMTQIDNSQGIIEEESRSKLKELANAIYSKARDINKEYTPINTGDSYGKQLIAMLNSYQDKKTRIITKEFVDGFWSPISAEKKIELFRVLRELFTNMKKHSKATFVGITFTKENEKMVVKYADNDITFKIGHLVKGDGLTNVENRVQGINGTIIFDTEPNLGLKVTIQFPI